MLLLVLCRGDPFYSFYLFKTFALILSRNDGTIRDKRVGRKRQSMMSAYFGDDDELSWRDLHGSRGGGGLNSPRTELKQVNGFCRNYRILKCFIVSSGSIVNPLLCATKMFQT